MSKLSNSIWCLIFLHLDSESFWGITLVCKQFNEVGNDLTLWSTYLTNKFGKSKTIHPESRKDCRTFLQLGMVRKYGEEIIRNTKLSLQCLLVTQDAKHLSDESLPTEWIKIVKSVLDLEEQELGLSDLLNYFFSSLLKIRLLDVEFDYSGDVQYKMEIKSDHFNLKTIMKQSGDLIGDNIKGVIFTYLRYSNLIDYASF
jgi:hypothetical protein